MFYQECLSFINEIFAKGAHDLINVLGTMIYSKLNTIQRNDKKHQIYESQKVE